MILKLSYKSQTRLYNKQISFQHVKAYTSKTFRDLPEAFTFIFQSANGELVYIESDQDLIGLKYCCSANNDYIVKLVIIRSDKVEDENMDKLVKQIVQVNLQKMNQSIIETLDQEILKDEVSEYLSEAYEKVSTDMAKAQSALIDQEVGAYLSNLYQGASTKLIEQQPIRRVALQRPKPIRIVKYSPQKPAFSKVNKSIDQIIDEKILKLVPSLVQKIYNKIQAKMENKCKQCIKRQIALERAIDAEINKKMDSSFTLLQDEENPEV